LKFVFYYENQDGNRYILSRIVLRNIQAIVTWSTKYDIRAISNTLKYFVDTWLCSSGTLPVAVQQRGTERITNNLKIKANEPADFEEALGAHMLYGQGSVNQAAPGTYEFGDNNILGDCAQFSEVGGNCYQRYTAQEDNSRFPFELRTLSGDSSTNCGDDENDDPQCAKCPESSVDSDWISTLGPRVYCDYYKQLQEFSEYLRDNDIAGHFEFCGNLVTFETSYESREKFGRRCGFPDGDYTGLAPAPLYLVKTTVRTITTTRSDGCTATAVTTTVEKFSEALLIGKGEECKSKKISSSTIREGSCPGGKRVTETEITLSELNEVFSLPDGTEAVEDTLPSTLLLTTSTTDGTLTDRTTTVTIKLINALPIYTYKVAVTYTKIWVGSAAAAAELDPPPSPGVEEFFETRVYTSAGGSDIVEDIPQVQGYLIEVDSIVLAEVFRT